MKGLFKGLVTAVAALGAALSLAPGVHAQEEVAKPLAIKVGLYIPSGGAARTAGSRSILMFEAAYTVQNLIDSNSTTEVSIGIVERDELHIIPFTIAQIYRSYDQTLQRGVYFGGGVGLYVVKMGLRGVTRDETKNLFGGFAVVGTNVTDRVFVEAKYHIISRYDKQRVDGLQLAVGTRF